MVPWGCGGVASTAKTARLLPGGRYLSSCPMALSSGRPASRAPKKSSQAVQGLLRVSATSPNRAGKRPKLSTALLISAFARSVNARRQASSRVAPRRSRSTTTRTPTTSKPFARLPTNVGGRRRLLPQGLCFRGVKRGSASGDARDVRRGKAAESPALRRRGCRPWPTRGRLTARAHDSEGFSAEHAPF